MSAAPDYLALLSEKMQEKTHQGGTAKTAKRGGEPFTQFMQSPDGTFFLQKTETEDPTPSAPEERKDTFTQFVQSPKGAKKIAIEGAPTALSPEDTDVLNRWLDLVGETDPETRRQVIENAAANPRALAGLLEVAARAGITPAPLFGPARTCGTCGRFRRTDHKHLGDCDADHCGSGASGLHWDSTPRVCNDWEGRP